LLYSQAKINCLQEKIIIIAAPSGAGKTTLVKRLVKVCTQLEFAISACTREPRPGEENGKDYYFYKVDEFKKLIEAGAFVEWEMVYTGKYYGTLKSEFQRIWDEGKEPLVEIDVKGAINIKQQYRNSSLSIFIEAPLEVLQERLKLRGTESAEHLAERLEKAKFELGFATQFDKRILNENIDTATEELVKVVEDFLAE